MPKKVVIIQDEQVIMAKHTEVLERLFDEKEWIVNVV